MNYYNKTKKFYLIIFFSFVILLLISLIAIQIGDNFISFKHFKENYFIIFEIRIPRVLGAIVCGASLGIAGAIMQAVLKNPLASPFTLGISHGALFGVSLGVIFFKNTFSISILAFLGAIIVIFTILLLAKKIFSPQSLILAGIAISAFFNALSMFLQYISDENELSEIINWSFGDLSKATYQNIFIIFLIFLLSFIYIYFKRWEYNAIEIKYASNLGINVKKLTIISLLIATLLTAINVSYFGIIGFIGLIAPHIVRIFIGDYRFLLPLSAIIGAILLVVSDTLARTILLPITLPVGILTSFIGAPLFLYLLINLRK